jgi:DNA-binding response OmpR family regulator
MGESAAARFRTLVTSFGTLGATVLYIVEGAEGAAWADGAAAGVIQTQTTPTGYRLSLPRWSGSGQGTSFEYELMEGIGMSVPQSRSAASLLRLSESVSKPGAPRILMVGFEEEQSTHLRSILSGEYVVDEAFGAGDGVAFAAERAPSVILLAKETGRISGSAMARKLRQAGHNMPIFLIGRQLHRTADQANLLSCGIDLCLNVPVHGRLLRLHVDNFLRRTGRLPHPLRTADERMIAAPPPRETVNCTTKLEYFCERLERERIYNEAFHLPLQAFVVRVPTGKPMVEELSGNATMATRSTDLVFAGKKGVAILLSEALSAEPFLARFAQTWRGPTPLIEPLKPSERTSVFDTLHKLLDGEAFSTPQREAAEVGA